ncbi:predicted protein, partial [Nematostella vectensis]
MLISENKKSVILGVFGITLILTAALMKYGVDQMLKWQLKKNVPLRPGTTDRYKQWIFPTVPIHIELYVFHVVNPDEVRSGATPVIRELGPYTYREYLLKENITFNQDETLVSYNQKKWYVFTPELSCSGCDPEADSVTTVNIAYAIMTEVAKSYSRIVRVGIDALLKYEKEHLFMTRTVREVLWGYDDPLFAEFSKLKDMFNLKFLPEISPLITMEYNETYDGISTVNTGTKNMDRTLDWIAWKGQSSMGLWNSSYANMINGSDGTQFPPGSGPGDTLPVLEYASPVWSALPEYLVELVESVQKKVLRIVFPNLSYHEALSHAKLETLCQRRETACIALVAKAKRGGPLKRLIPIPVATHHGYGLRSDPQLRTQVKGLKPDREKHGLYISIEPTTGIPLQALIRLQINVFIQSVPGISETTGIPQAFVPVMHFSNNASVDDSTARTLREGLVVQLLVAKYAEMVVFALGGVFILAAIGLTVR